MNKSLKYYSFGIVIMLLALVLIYGYMASNMLSKFLLFSLITCFIYFLISIRHGRVIESGKRIHLAKIFSTFYKISLITSIYLCSLYTLTHCINPGTTKPYFHNTDHNAITNYGVAFNNNIALFTPSNSENVKGLWSHNSSQLSALDMNNGNIRLTFNYFTLPLFIQYGNDSSKTKFTPFNNIYAESVNDGFILEGQNSIIEVMPLVIEDKLDHPETKLDYLIKILNTFLSKSSQKHKYNTCIKININCKNSAILESFGYGLSYTDTIYDTLNKSIEHGISLENLLLSSKHWRASKKDSRNILQRIINGFGDCYLLQNQGQNETKYLTFFPSSEFLQNDYAIYVQNHKLSKELSFNKYITYNTLFYIGLENIEKKCCFLQTKNSGIANDYPTTLEFAFPDYFTLGTGNISPKTPSASSVRFLKNHYRQLINSDFKEGFLFHENLRFAKCNLVDGIIEYANDQGLKPLKAKFIDKSSSDLGSKDIDGQFYMLSQDRIYAWLYNIRDFSKNNFSFIYIISCLTIIFLAIIAVLAFYSEEGLGRIEPIIYAVAYALIVVRYFLLWRVATFPPLDNIKEHELNSLLNSDIYYWNLCHWLKIPIYLTLYITLVFPLTIIVIRILNRNRIKIIHLTARFSNVASRIFFRNRNRIKDQSHEIRHKYVKYYLLITIVSWFIKPVMPDVVARLLCILAPVFFYFYFCKRIFANPYNTNTPDRLIPPNFENTKNKKYLQNIKYNIRSFFYYLIDSDEFYLSFIALLYFLLVERGFGVVFLVFLILKNILINITRKQTYSVLQNLKSKDNNQDDEENRSIDDKISFIRVFRFRNYWIYSFLFLFIYILIIHDKSFFKFIFDNKIFFIEITLICTILYMVSVSQKKIKYIIAALAFLASIGVWIKADKIELYANESFAHTVYRASMLYQPVEEIIAKANYNSFESKKIIETAEGQWFINCYIQKPYNPDKEINLRPFFNTGVGYITQTRDVVLPRFVIAELGNWVMWLLLILLALPMAIYVISFKVYKIETTTNNRKYFVLSHQAYPGMLALILIFSIAFLVWLTSTNRFVFFGQDFPFLSLTSKTSIILPLMLFIFPLTSHPETYENNAEKNKLKIWFWILIISALAIMIWTTSKTENLKETNFEIHLAETKAIVDNKLNLILEDIQKQDSNQKYLRHQTDLPPDPIKIINILKNSPAFHKLLDSSDTLTKSILNFLVNSPLETFKPESPIYLRFDTRDTSFNVSFNNTLYLELPAYESEKTWKGNIYEEQFADDSSSVSNLTIEGKHIPIKNIPIALQKSGPIQIAILPANWFIDKQKPLALVSITNKSKTKIEILNTKTGIEKTQDVAEFASELKDENVEYSICENMISPLCLKVGVGQPFMENLFVNGKRRMVYPAGEKCFWVYHYSKSADIAFTSAQKYDQNATITIDYDLNNDVYNYLQQYRKEDSKNLNCGVIAADGDGNIRLMTDFVMARKIIDPNCTDSVNKMLRKNFFYEDDREQRSQWANLNLVSLNKGPGSSIKPVVLAAVTSMVNANWSCLHLTPSPVSYLGKYGEFDHYAGLGLNKNWDQKHNGDDGAMGIVDYITHSSNIFHSVVLFLGSYEKEKFRVTQGHYDISKILTTENDGGINFFPSIKINGLGSVYHLPSYNSGSWPKTEDHPIKGITYFGNTRSILADGLETNMELQLIDENKIDYSLKSNRRKNFAFEEIFDSISRKPKENFLWCYPVESFFLQTIRTGQGDMNSNFVLGLKNPTFGGYPYEITPLKMAEMYGRLATQNKDYYLHIAPRRITNSPWEIDSTWHNNEYSEFLSDYVFEGMKDVIVNGTATNIKDKNCLNINSNVYKGYFLFAKTGTIDAENNKSKNNRRFEIIISKNDLTDRTLNFNGNRFYTIYFTLDNKGDQDWEMFCYVINQILNSSSFKSYMK